MAYVDELLGRDERVLAVARRHLLVLIGRVVSELLLIAIMILAGVVSRNAFASQQVGGVSIGQIVLLICTAISAILLVSIGVDYLRWNSDQFLLTDRRVIKLSGVFNKTMIDSSLDKINDVALRQTWLGRIFDYGDIEVLTGADEAVNRMDGIARPLGFKRAMSEAKADYNQGYSYLDPAVVVPYVQSPQDIQGVLSELATLRDRGILSSDEFEAKKRDLLSRI
jgi:hypothetical protein